MKDFKTNLNTTESVATTIISNANKVETKADEEIKYCLRLPKALKKDYERLSTETDRTIKDLVIEALEDYANKAKNKALLEKYR